MSFKSILIKDASKKKKFWKQEHSLEDLRKNKFDKAPNISISSSLTKFSKKTQKLEKYTFFIVGPFFGYQKTNCEEIKYLDLTLSVLSDIKSESKPQFGFTLVRHSSNKKDFFARDSSDAEMWLYKLRRFCVQRNFSARYELLQQVGKGNFSTVHKVKSKLNNKFYAAKMIEVDGLGKSSKLRTAVRAELSIQRSMNHPNIIQFFEVFEEETNIYIITELLEGGELFERVLKRKRYSEEEAAQVIKQVLEALVYLKKKEIIHRDLKLENVILVKENDACLVKIVDFGLSTTLGSFDAQVKCGTPGYVAPEIILNKPYSCKADIFSTGVMLYILLSGCTPFPGKTFDEILARNKKCNPKFTSTYWSNVSFEAIDFIITLLSADPNKRPTPSDALEAPWMTKMLANAPQRSNVNSTDISVEEYKLKQSNQLQGNSKTGKTIQDADSLALLQTLVPARRRDTPFSKKHSLTVQPDNDAFTKKFLKRHSMVPDTKESPTSMHKKIVQRNLLKKLETFDPTSVEEATDSNDQQSLYAFSHSKFNLNSGLFLNSFYEKGASQGVFSEMDVQTPKRAMMEGQENLGRRSFFGKRYSMRYEVGTNNPTSNIRIFDDENIPEEENTLNGMMNSLKTMCFLSKPLFQNYDTGDSDLKRSAVSHFPDLRNSFKKRLNRPGISFIV